MSAAPSVLRPARLLTARVPPARPLTAGPVTARLLTARTGTVLLLSLPLATVLAGAPAEAAERVVTVTAEGVEPEVLEVDPGDTVRIVVRDRTFAYRAQSTGGAWRFDSGPVALLRGDFVVPGPVRAPGTYTYRVAQDAPYRGTVVVRGPDGALPSDVPTPSPAAGGAPVPDPAGPPPDTPPPATPAPDTPAPDTPAPDTGAPDTGAPDTGAPVPRALPAVPGVLPGARTSRGLGLPVALAVVLVLGSASLVVRLLLALPDGSARHRA